MIKTVLNLICLSLTIASAVVSQGTGTESADRALAAGIEAMRSRDLAQARIELEKAARENPDSPEANLQLGLLLGQQGSFMQASKAFRKAVEVQPDWPEAHYNLGLILIADATGARDWPGAMAEFRTSLRLRPGYAEAHRMLAAGFTETGKPSEAIAELHAALAANPNFADAHLDLGKALEQAGQTGMAEEEYQEALRLRPRYADGEIALGKLLVKGAHTPAAFDEAVEHFRRALRIDPDNAAGQYALAAALKREGKRDEAAVAFRQTKVLASRMEDQIRCTHLSNEGLDAAARGDRAAAVRMLEEAVELRPDIALPHYNLGLILADNGDLQTGRAQVIEAISLAPFDPRFYIALGRMWKRAENAQRARDAFERAARLDPGNSAAIAELRDLASSGGQSDTGSQSGEDAYPYGAPTDTPAAHFAFATVLARRGDWTGATGEWLRVLTLQPDNADARNNLGVCYAHTGEDEKAELEFRKALQISPDSAGAHFGLAILALQHGNSHVAIQELREVTRIQPDYPQAERLLSAALKQTN